MSTPQYTCKRKCQLREMLGCFFHSKRTLKQEVLSFFSCIAGLVRDMVGQQLELVEIEIKFPGRSKPTKTTKPQTNQRQQATPTHKPGTRPVVFQGNLQKRWNKWNKRAPLSPSNVLFHRPPCSTPPRCPCLDVSHINICTRIRRRVSNVWLQTSSLDLIRTLTCLPPFCTILHECINFRLCYCFLVW